MIHASLHPQHRIERAFSEPLKIHQMPFDKDTIEQALAQVDNPAITRKIVDFPQPERPIKLKVSPC